MRILVTGGVRSGKSRHAEQLLAQRSAVTYIAPGPTIETARDPDWTARVEAHQRRRPSSWTTVETADLAVAMRADHPVLIDCLGTWLTTVLDERQLWEASHVEVTTAVEALVEPIVAAVAARDDVVIVTNEVGLGVVPSHRSGRVFRDLLGLVNQRVGTVCDEVHLVISGRVLILD